MKLNLKSKRLHLVSKTSASDTFEVVIISKNRPRFLVRIKGHIVESPMWGAIVRYGVSHPFRIGDGNKVEYTGPGYMVSEIETGARIVPSDGSWVYWPTVKEAVAAADERIKKEGYGKFLRAKTAAMKRREEAEKPRLVLQPKVQVLHLKSKLPPQRGASKAQLEHRAKLFLKPKLILRSKS